MVEKKAVEKKVEAKSTTSTKAPAVKKAPVKKVVLHVDALNAGFRAGDVYQALSAAGAAMTVAQLAKATKKTESEVLLGIGWLLKEGKVKGEDGKVSLA